MKSGYGFSLSWSPTTVAPSGSILPTPDAYTDMQCVSALVPEYGYSTGDGQYRTLEGHAGGYCFFPNPDADGQARLHFIPVYARNGSYVLFVTGTQLWTPAGMVSVTRSAAPIILDGSIFDDYFVGRKN